MQRLVNNIIRNLTENNFHVVAESEFILFFMAEFILFSSVQSIHDLLDQHKSVHHEEMIWAAYIDIVLKIDRNLSLLTSCPRRSRSTA